MAQPAVTPVWASDTNIAAGTEAGTPTKVDPGAAYNQQGFVPGLGFVGPYINFLLYWVTQWIAYVKDLHNDAYFLGRAYTWTGLHAFTNAGAHIFTGALTTLGVLTGASITTNGSIYSNATITALGSINSSVGSITAAGAVTGASFAFGAPATVTRYMPLVGMNEATGGWRQKSTSPRLDCVTTTGVINIPLELPVGVTLTNITVGVVAGAGSVSSPITVTALLINPAAGTATTLGSAATASGTGAQALSIGTISHVVDTARTYSVRIYSSDLASSTADEIVYISFTASVPGPRTV